MAVGQLTGSSALADTGQKATVKTAPGVITTGTRAISGDVVPAGQILLHVSGKQTASINKDFNTEN